MTNINTMIDRTGAVLDYLYKTDGPVGVSNIANNLDFPKATVFRILTTLEKWGIIEKQIDTDKYKLGIVLIKYGAKAASDLSLVKVATPIINNLSKEIGESVNLSIEHMGYSLNIYRSTNDNSILASKLIPISSLNCSSSGKIFLSRKSEKDLIEYFNSENCPKRTANSIITYEDYQKEKESILNSNIAFENEEYEYGLSCISSPITHKGKVVAAISVSGPKSRLEIKGTEMIKENLILTCNTVINLIDYLDSDRLL